MLGKCSACDEKGVKTINTDNSKFIKDGSSYYHYDCYVAKLIKSKKMSKEDALLETERLRLLYRNEIEEAKIKDDLFTLIMDLYDQVLPSFFYIQVDRITKGTYKKGNKQKISYGELLEMYSNEKMIHKLDKVAHSKTIEQGNRANWDLAVMFNEYPRYANHKKKLLKNSQSMKEAIDNINKYKINPKDRLRTTRIQTEESNKDSIDIGDLADDMLI